MTLSWSSPLSTKLSLVADQRKRSEDVYCLWTPWSGAVHHSCLSGPQEQLHVCTSACMCAVGLCLYHTSHCSKALLHTQSRRKRSLLPQLEGLSARVLGWAGQDDRLHFRPWVIFLSELGRRLGLPNRLPDGGCYSRGSGADRISASPVQNATHMSPPLL